MLTQNLLEAAAVGAHTGGSYWRNPATGLPFVPETHNTGSYLDRLSRMYGNVRIASVSHEPHALEAAGRGMSGRDVVIAPLIYERMSCEPAAAAYFERKISEFFDATPRMESGHAERGLDYRPCGVVIHADSTVTYICGDTSYSGPKNTSGTQKFFCKQRMDALEEQSMLVEFTCALPARTDIEEAVASLEECLEMQLGGSPV